MGLDPSALASGETNPAQLLQEMAAGSGAHVVGHEAVRGVPATRYAGKLNLLKAIESLPGTNVARARETFARLGSQLGGEIPVEAWIDSHGLVRKLPFTRPRLSAHHALA